MPLRLHSHDEACDCAAHRPSTGSKEGSGIASALVAVLACAICPPCLTTYAKLFSVLGVGFSLSDFHHLVLLVFAITASVGISAWRSWRTRRIWPIAIATTGSAMIALGHAADELHAVEWAGVLLLLAGGLTEHLRLRRLRGQPSRVAA
jgi:hypothetical protein